MVPVGVRSFHPSVPHKRPLVAFNHVELSPIWHISKHITIPYLFLLQERHIKSMNSTKSYLSKLNSDATGIRGKFNRSLGFLDRVFVSLDPQHLNGISKEYSRKATNQAIYCQKQQEKLPTWKEIPYIRRNMI
jgi:hypothetical protein